VLMQHPDCGCYTGKGSTSVRGVTRRTGEGGTVAFLLVRIPYMSPTNYTGEARTVNDLYQSAFTI